MFVTVAGVRGLGGKKHRNIGEGKLTPMVEVVLKYMPTTQLYITVNHSSFIMFVLKEL